MANRITRHIPNTVTCCNLFCGCVAVVMAYQSDYLASFTLIILAAVFDFFDGMLARALKAYSPMGKELDSLADDISFGLAPSMIVFSLFKEVHIPSFLQPIETWLPYVAFLIAIFSALRLAKFNIDTRQTSSFIGMPTPANALFWSSLAVGGHDLLISDKFNALYLILLVLFTSWLLIAEIPMFSLKFKSLSWQSNKTQYVFLIVSLPLIILLGKGSLAAIIIWYATLSLATSRKH